MGKSRVKTHLNIYLEHGDQGVKCEGLNADGRIERQPSGGVLLPGYDIGDADRIHLHRFNVIIHENRIGVARLRPAGIMSIT